MIIEIKGLIQGVDKTIPIQLSSNVVFDETDTAKINLFESYSGCKVDELTTENDSIVLDPVNKLLFLKFRGENSKTWKYFFSDDYLIKLYGTLYIEDADGHDRLFSGQQFTFKMRVGEVYG